MMHRCRVRLAWPVLAIGLVVGCCERGYLGAQTIRVEGAVAGTAGKSAPKADPRDARRLSASEFSKLDEAARVRLMAAWSAADATAAGDDLFPLIEVALQDANENIRRSALAVFNRVQLPANIQRVRGTPARTDHQRYPALLTTLLKLVDHSDPNLRWGVMNAVMMFDPAEPCRYEDVLLQRELKEPADRVRAQIVRVLGTACGRLGSKRTLELIGRALGDGEPVDVQSSAITALRTVRLPGGAERLLGKLTAPSPMIRAAAARRLQQAYPADARQGRDVIERALAVEADPTARRALRELLDSLDRP